MNITAFFYVSVCAFFFNTLLTKKGPHTLMGRAGCGHLWTSERAGQSSSILAIAFLFFSLQRGGFFSSYIIIFFSFSFKVSMKDGGGVKNFARFSSFFAKFPLKFMPLSSRLQLFHQFLVRPQTGTPTAGHQL